MRESGFCAHAVLTPGVGKHGLVCKHPDVGL